MNVDVAGWIDRHLGTLLGIAALSFVFGSKGMLDYATCEDGFCDEHMNDWTMLVVAGLAIGHARWRTGPNQFSRSGLIALYALGSIGALLALGYAVVAWVGSSMTSDSEGFVLLAFGSFTVAVAIGYLAWCSAGRLVAENSPTGFGGTWTGAAFALLSSAPLAVPWLMAGPPEVASSAEYPDRVAFAAMAICMIVLPTFRVFKMMVASFEKPSFVAAAGVMVYDAAVIAWIVQSS